MFFGWTIDPFAERNNVIKLLQSYDCKAVFPNMTDEELKDHLYEHQFDSNAGEWPEDP